jgi:molybdopterin-guanine dinucleotide biosynthesis protein A
MDEPAATFSNCTAAVLAGGRGVRFCGDKPLAPFRGTNLLSYLIEQLRLLRFQEILVVAKNLDPYREALAKLVTPDQLLRFVSDDTELLTPLAGVTAALRASRSNWLFACGADMPFAGDRKLLEALFDKADGHAAVAPIHNNNIQPLNAIWNRMRCLEPAELLLREEKVGPRALLKRVDAATIDWIDERPFRDADTREALATIDS